MEIDYTIAMARPEHLAVLADIELRSELEAIVRDEAGRGLDRAQRVVMEYRKAWRND